MPESENKPETRKAKKLASQGRFRKPQLSGFIQKAFELNTNLEAALRDLLSLYTEARDGHVVTNESEVLQHVDATLNQADKVRDLRHTTL